MSSITQPDIPEVSWFSALCDDDYEFLGVPEPALASSWEHCRDIVQAADRGGFDNVLLPSGYDLGIDSTAFSAAIATHTEQIHLLLAVRMGEMWLPQLARQIASIDQFARRSPERQHHQLRHPRRGARLRTALPAHARVDAGAPQAAQPRADRLPRRLRRPRCSIRHGRRPSTTTCPPFYFGGFSPAAKDVAAAEADVFLTWPDTVAAVGDTVTEMTALARERYDRELLYGLRAHMIVRDTEAEAQGGRRTPRLQARRGDRRGDPEQVARRRLGRRVTAGRPACVGIRRRIRRGLAVDGGRARPFRCRCGDRRRSRSGRCQAPGVPGRRRPGVHPVRLHPPGRVRSGGRTRASTARTLSDQAAVHRRPLSRSVHGPVMVAVDTDAMSNNEWHAGPIDGTVRRHAADRRTDATVVVPRMAEVPRAVIVPATSSVGAPAGSGLAAAGTPRRQAPRTGARIRACARIRPGTAPHSSAPPRPPCGTGHPVGRSR